MSTTEETEIEMTGSIAEGAAVSTAEAAAHTDTEAPAGETLLQLRGVTRSYRSRGREVTALAGVDLDVRRGEFITIQGPTGGGKSTLLQLLGALEAPSSGGIDFDGVDLSRASAGQLTRLRAERVGFVFQSFNLIPTLTASENVETALVPAHVPAEERRERARAALAAVGLADRGDHRPSELSGGQQQRVAIARAIVKRPSLLLADEPTGNLDERTRDEIMDLLEGFWRDGLTLVIVTHDSAVAKRADRRLWLEGGRVREKGAARQPV